MPQYKSIASALVVAAAFAAPLLSYSASVSAGSPFAGFAGSWSGGGTMRLEGGRSERLKCRASYTDRGTQLGIALRCASASNAVDMRATLTATGSRISGSWEERTFGATGGASGTVVGNRITLSIEGLLAGTMTVTTSGNSQSVSISTQGVALQGVQVALLRN